MGSYNSINEIIIYGDDAIVINKDSIIYHSSEHPKPTEYKFENDILKDCHSILSNLKGKSFVKFGHYDNVIYYISKIDKLNITYNSSKISKVSYGYKLNL